MKKNQKLMFNFADLPLTPRQLSHFWQDRLQGLQHLFLLQADGRNHVTASQMSWF